MTFVCVTPPDSAQAVLHEFSGRCAAEEEMRELTPSITDTDVPGRLRIELEFHAEDLEEAEQTSDFFIRKFFVNPNPLHPRDALTRVGNTLSCA
ncbi:hypothetical protein ACFSSC_09660 [Corynebacterium mendelii]|uniref:Uncharacterized protein n=1 Tax=Corynebacterium mendelii TaxID=2765362 RepID=A0A939IY76_9CORY|nr:hypothetical protein [Corynebacterium mendelii]MBN9645245.1 hypothetical protein [Corynebacterium mendelii]